MMMGSSICGIWGLSSSSLFTKMERHSEILISSCSCLAFRSPGSRFSGSELDLLWCAEGFRFLVNCCWMSVENAEADTKKEGSQMGSGCEMLSYKDKQSTKNQGSGFTPTFSFILFISIKNYFPPFPSTFWHKFGLIFKSYILFLIYVIFFFLSSNTGGCLRKAEDKTLLILVEIICLNFMQILQKQD